MTDEKLFENLKHLVVHNNCFTSEMIEVLIEYKNSGGQQENAKIFVERLRTCFVDNECKDDIVLEILDIITGWCNPKLRIWN